MKIKLKLFLPFIAKLKMYCFRKINRNLKNIAPENSRQDGYHSLNNIGQFKTIHFTRILLQDKRG